VEICGSTRKFFSLDPFLNGRASESPQLAHMNTTNQATPGISLESLWMDSDDGCRFLAVDEAFRNLGSRRKLWRSERLPVGNGLRFHCLTSSCYLERQAFPRAPFRYPASGRAVLSNNFLEVGYNFLGFAASSLRFVRSNLSTGDAAMMASKIFLLGNKTKSQ
jgi:hypothetical protein